MGRRWFLAVKKIFSSEWKDDDFNKKLKKKKAEKSKDFKNSPGQSEESTRAASQLQLKQVLTDVKIDRNQHAYSEAMATAEAAAAAQTATEVARLTTFSLRAIHGRARSETAAIKIQAAFRGYLARKGTGTLRGLVRVKLMANRNAVKRQTINTLHAMQTLAKVQSQIRERRTRLSEENQALYRQRQLKREKELEKLKLGEDWVDSPQSKEQFEAKLQKKQEAALRRERTLAYAYSHQWRSNSTRYKKPAFIDPAKQQWGWSWLERWTYSRPWESNQGCIAGRDRSIVMPNCEQTITRNSSKTSSRGPSRPSLTFAPNQDRNSLLGIPSNHHRRRHSIGGSFCFGDANSKVNHVSLASKQLPMPACGGSKKPLFAAAKQFSGHPKRASFGMER